MTEPETDSEWEGMPTIWVSDEEYDPPIPYPIIEPDPEPDEDQPY